MRRQYLHLSTYHCLDCEGPVVSGSLAVRESEISEKSEIRELGGICLSCGRKQEKPAKPSLTRDFPPVPWEATPALDAVRIATAPTDYITQNRPEEATPKEVQSRMLLVELDPATPNS
jgi:hypothetical protein